MLIEFSVTNFRSIKDRQTLSMVASKNKEVADVQLLEAPAVAPGIKLLPLVAIYGANASGKTNLLDAGACMGDIVTSSAHDGHRGVPVSFAPFKLDPKTRNAPSEFEVVFIAEGIRYQYGFAATQQRITKEWLFAFPRNRRQCWFTRTRENGKDQWRFGAQLKGKKELWREATRDNALFLSTAVRLNNQQLRPIFDWFATATYRTDSQGWAPDFSASVCEDEDRKKIMLGFLKAADLGINDLQIKPGEIHMVHKDATGKRILFSYNDESHGTQKFFSVVGPWIDILSKGSLLLADELHSTLHPKLFEFLMGLFNSKKVNRYNAQLIFVTHDTSVLDQRILRRDQIWFCEKDNETAATTVFPLTDFRPRKGRENLELAYLSGRYGAVPYISEPRF